MQGKENIKINEKCSQILRSSFFNDGIYFAEIKSQNPGIIDTQDRRQLNIICFKQFIQFNTI